MQTTAPHHNRRENRHQSKDDDGAALLFPESFERIADTITILRSGQTDDLDDFTADSLDMFLRFRLSTFEVEVDSPSIVNREGRAAPLDIKNETCSRKQPGSLI